MPHVNKKQSGASKIIWLTATAIVAGIFGVIYWSQAATGLNVGSSALDLAGSNLFYGVTSATTTAGNFLLLEKGAGNGIFKIDSLGNATLSGTTGLTLSGVGADLNFTATGSPNTITSAAGVNLSLLPGTGGYVGVGLTNPGVTLDVTGSARNSLATTHSLLGGAGNVLVMADNTGTLYSTSTASFISSNGLGLWGGTTTGNIWSLNSGNVGIGTTSPNSKLDVINGINGLSSDGGNLAFNREAHNGTIFSSTGYAYQFQHTGSTTPTADYLALQVYNPSGGGVTSQALVANGAGNVGIGTTNPVNALDVVRTGADATTNYAALTIRQTNASSYGPSFILDASAGTGGHKYGFVSDSTLDGAGVGKLQIYDYTAVATRLLIDTTGNVGIGTTAPGASLDVFGRTSKFSNLQPLYQWYFGGGYAASSTWMKIADVVLGTNTYVGTNFKVTIMDAANNSGSSVNALAMTYYVRMTRSGAVQDDTNNAQVSGPSVNYVRVVQTATGVYELQVNQPSDWRYITVTAQAYAINSLGVGGSIVYATTPVAGSTTGTIYTATAVNTDYFSNLFTLGKIGVGTTNPGVTLDISGSLRDSLATTFSLLAGSGNVLVMADNTGALYSTSTASFISNNGLGLWSGTTGGNIWSANSGSIGIGITNPGAKLEVSPSTGTYGLNLSGTLNAASQYAMNMTTTLTGTSTNKGIFFGPNQTSISSGGYYGIDSRPYFSATSGGPQPTFYGTLSIPTITSAATAAVTTMYGELIRLDNLSTAGSVVTNAYGLQIANPTATGAITNNYGLYIASQTAGATDFALYSGGGTNYFAGNVGIGTTNPGYSLDVSGNAQISGASGNTSLYIANTGSGGQSFRWIAGKTGDTVPGGLSLYDNTNSAYRLVVSATGLVGVGTTNPGVALDVTGALRNSLATTHSLLGGSGNVIVMSDNTGTLYSTSTASFISNNGLGLWGGTTGGNIWSLNSGNVGIGTTTPAAKLEIVSNMTAATTTELLRLTVKGNGGDELSGEGGAINFYTPMTPAPDLLGAQIYTYRESAANSVINTALRFGTNGGSGTTDRLVINSTGNVGIGTTNPGNLLEVAGTTQVGTASATAAQLTVLGGSGGSAMIRLSRTSGTTAAFNWSLSGGGLSFADETNGGLPLNLFGGSTLQAYIGQRAATIATTAGSLLGATTFAAGAGTDVAATTLTIQGGLGTGAGTLGNIYFNTGVLGSSGTTPQTASTKMTILGSGNVGIGNTNPGTKLDITGSLRDSLATTFSLLAGSGNVMVMADNTGTLFATTTIPNLSNYLPLSGGTMTNDINLGGYNLNNVTKLSVSTIDPLYLIKGTNYATFAASIAGGVKEEYVGKAEITQPAGQEYEAVIDFSKLSEGSDLWVWRQVIDFNKDNVEVYLTPYGQFAQTYYVITGNKLVLRSDRPVEVSYRLIGRRFDWQAWPTKPSEQTGGGLVIK